MLHELQIFENEGGHFILAIKIKNLTKIFVKKQSSYLFFFFFFCIFKKQEAVEKSLQTIYDITIDNIGTLCSINQFLALEISLNAQRYEGSRQRVELAADILQEVGIIKHTGEYQLIN